MALYRPLIGRFNEFVRVPGNGYFLGKRRHTEHGRGQTHPQGAIAMLACGAATLVKGIALNCAPSLAGKHRGSAECVN
ncbi:MAG: hypothetical protein QMC06_12025 [Gammaproteobacteria bacterium]